MMMTSRDYTTLFKKPFAVPSLLYRLACMSLSYCCRTDFMMFHLELACLAVEKCRDPRFDRFISRIPLDDELFLELIVYTVVMAIQVFVHRKPLFRNCKILSRLLHGWVWNRNRRDLAGSGGAAIEGFERFMTSNIDIATLPDMQVNAGFTAVDTSRSSDNDLDPWRPLSIDGAAARSNVATNAQKSGWRAVTRIKLFANRVLKAISWIATVAPFRCIKLLRWPDFFGLRAHEELKKLMFERYSLAKEHKRDLCSAIECYKTLIWYQRKADESDIKISQLERNVSELKSDKIKSHAETLEAELTISMLQAFLSQTQKKNAELEESLITAKSENAQTQKKNAELEESLITAKSENAQTQKKNAELEESLITAKGENAQSQSRITMLEEKLVVAESGRAQSQSEAAALQKKLVITESDKAQSQSQITVLKERLISSESGKAQSQSEAAELKEKLAFERSDNAQSKIRIVVLEEDLALAKGDKARFQTTITELHTSLMKSDNDVLVTLTQESKTQNPQVEESDSVLGLQNRATKGVEYVTVYLRCLLQLMQRSKIQADAKLEEVTAQYELKIDDYEDKLFDIEYEARHYCDHNFELAEKLFVLKAKDAENQKKLSECENKIAKLESEKIEAAATQQEVSSDCQLEDQYNALKCKYAELAKSEVEQKIAKELAERKSIGLQNDLSDFFIENRVLAERIEELEKGGTNHKVTTTSERTLENSENETCSAAGNSDDKKFDDVLEIMEQMRIRRRASNSTINENLVSVFDNLITINKRFVEINRNCNNSYFMGSEQTDDDFIPSELAERDMNVSLQSEVAAVVTDSNLVHQERAEYDENVPPMEVESSKDLILLDALALRSKVPLTVGTCSRCQPLPSRIQPVFNLELAEKGKSISSKEAESSGDSIPMIDLAPQGTALLTEEDANSMDAESLQELDLVTALAQRNTVPLSVNISSESLSDLLFNSNGLLKRPREETKKSSFENSTDSFEIYRKCEESQREIQSLHCIQDALLLELCRPELRVLVDASSSYAAIIHEEADSNQLERRPPALVPVSGEEPNEPNQLEPARASVPQTQVMKYMRKLREEWYQHIKPYQERLNRVLSLTRDSTNEDIQNLREYFNDSDEAKDALENDMGMMSDDDEPEAEDCLNISSLRLISIAKENEEDNEKENGEENKEEKMNMSNEG